MKGASLRRSEPEKGSGSATLAVLAAGGGTRSFWSLEQIYELVHVINGGLVSTDRYLGVVKSTVSGKVLIMDLIKLLSETSDCSSHIVVEYLRILVVLMPALAMVGGGVQSDIVER